MPRPAREPSSAAAVASLWLGLAALSSCATALAQPARTDGPGVGIYTCVDARGRTLTADRPIAECSDREQRELGPSGTVRRKLEPTYTAREQQEREDRAREAAIQAARLIDERRRERALLVRYPNATTHDRERVEALSQIDAVIQAAKKRLVELADDRKKRVDRRLRFPRFDLRDQARRHSEAPRELTEADVLPFPGSAETQTEIVPEARAIDERLVDGARAPPSSCFRPSVCHIHLAVHARRTLAVVR